MRLLCLARQHQDTILKPKTMIDLLPIFSRSPVFLFLTKFVLLLFTITKLLRHLLVGLLGAQWANYSLSFFIEDLCVSELDKKSAHHREILEITKDPAHQVKNVEIIWHPQQWKLSQRWALFFSFHHIHYFCAFFLSTAKSVLWFRLPLETI